MWSQKHSIYGAIIIIIIHHYHPLSHSRPAVSDLYEMYGNVALAYGSCNVMLWAFLKDNLIAEGRNTVTSTGEGALDEEQQTLRPSPSNPGRKTVGIKTMRCSQMLNFLNEDANHTITTFLLLLLLLACNPMLCNDE